MLTVSILKPSHPVQSLPVSQTSVSMKVDWARTFVKPEIDGFLVQSLAYDGILPVQVGLLLAEQVKVVLLRTLSAGFHGRLRSQTTAHLFGCLVPFPHAATEIALPITRRVAYTIDVPSRAPDVPVALGIGL